MVYGSETWVMRKADKTHVVVVVEQAHSINFSYGVVHLYTHIYVIQDV
jgi:hypothetical protein